MLFFRHVLNGTIYRHTYGGIDNAAWIPMNAIIYGFQRPTPGEIVMLHPLRELSGDCGQIFLHSISISYQTRQCRKQRQRRRWWTGFLMGGRAGDRAGLRERNHGRCVFIDLPLAWLSSLAQLLRDHKRDRWKQR